ncbi:MULTISPECIES: hypothetical protein [Bradyrhizobium]|uniref:Uncharacterized protein n=1 Tax=Bradyrhizobium yuanmingense TaxID=108015 RepID=A0ABV4GME8_9BRAD|nr:MULTISPECIES: hypothetical protein [Bradyrhizobium]MCA1378599.1 hypothetical protein [Bradyrhizobium sp. IC4060]MCA1488574.1 hypothetical protein [Bradyrhizobium sp. IC4061]
MLLTSASEVCKQSVALVAGDAQWASTLERLGRRGEVTVLIGTNGASAE